MTYESDLQLRAAGLQPMEHLPRKHMGRYVMRLRDGRDVTVTLAHNFELGWCYYAVDNGETEYDWHDFVGWRNV